jgi:dihydroorotate dehydrogenase (fumarate)
VTDLHTTYLGLRLRSPLVASAGPFTGDLGRLTQLVEAGAGAVVLPSLFQEQIEHETTELDRLFSVHRESFAEATTFFPEVRDVDTVVDLYLAHLEAARREVDVPVIASLNGTSLGGWVRYARLLEEAGADAIELNLYEIAADPAASAAMIEAEQLELVAMLADEVAVPIAVKISPFYTSVSSFAVELQQAGAAGIVMFNRFYLPDLDLETLDVVPRLALSTPDELRLPLRWIGIVREHLRISLAASTGVHSGEDAAKLLLAGADVAMTTSAVLRNGPSHLTRMEDELRRWMAENEYADLDEMRGAVRRDAAVEPEAYERANYIGNLAIYTSRFLASPAPPR